jgi:hypothetical protein
MNVNLLFETISNEQDMIEEFNRRLSVLDEKKRKKCVIKPTDSANKIRRKCKQARVWGLHYAPVWNYYMARHTQSTPELPASNASDGGSEGGDSGGADSGGGDGGGMGEAGFMYPMSIGAENDPRLINDELVSPESHLKPLSYVYPNTEYEWGEAKRYSELKPLGKEEWGELVSDGEVYSWSELVDVSNYDEDLQNLLPTKLNNVKTLIQAGEIQLPIVGRWPSGEYELISGNTRIAVLTKLGYDPYVIVIDMPAARKKSDSVPKKKPKSTKKKAPSKKKEKPKSSTERVRRYYRRHPEKVRKYLRDTQEDRVKRNGDRANAVKKYGKKKMKNHDVHHPNGVDGSWKLARKDHGRDKKNESIEYIYLSELTDGMAPNGPWQLIAEGGSMHHAHPYEDDSLTFKDIKKMIMNGLVGTLGTDLSVVDKLDGQNIMFSVREGQLIFARSKGQVKSRGKNALDAAGARQMFSGRGNIESAFKDFIEDLQATIASLPPNQQQQMFAEGAKFMDVMVVFPDSKNVIPYNKNVHIFHGTVQYDEAGNDIAKNMQDGKIFADELTVLNSEKQKASGVTASNSIVFDDSDTSSNLQKVKEYVSLVSRLADELELDDKNTIEDYRKAWWAREINNLGIEWTTQERKGLIDRWATGTKRFGIKNVEDPDKKTTLRNFEANQLTKLQIIVNKPLEKMFVNLGVHILKRVVDFLSANNPAVAAELKKELIRSIEAIQSTKEFNKLAKLQIQLERLEEIGMDNLVPSEGLVFIYKGEPYKFTGAFSPVNQIIGTLKFKKGKAEDSDMETDEPEEEVPVTVEKPVEPPSEPAEEPEEEEEPVIDQPADGVVGIVSGKFQPFHAGHYSIYKAMVTKFGKDNVYIVTTNNTDSIKSPFGFKEKKDIMMKMFNIPNSKIVQVKQPYVPKEILGKLPPSTMYVAAVSQKNAEQLAGIDYFKPYEDTPPESRKGNSQQGYYMVAPEMQLQIDGKNISGGQIRTLMGDPAITDRAKQEIFTKIYGRFDKKTFDKVVKTSTQSEEAKKMTSTFGADGGARARIKRPEDVPSPRQTAPEDVPQPRQTAPEEDSGRKYYEPGQTWTTQNGFYAAKDREGNIKYFETPEQALQFSRK